MTITVLHNQSLLDLALQHTGTIESVFEMAEANALNITDDVRAGKTLVVPAEAFTNKDILAITPQRTSSPPLPLPRPTNKYLNALRVLAFGQ